MSNPAVTLDAFFCISLDGSIAWTDGIVDSLSQAMEDNKPLNVKDFGTADFISSIGAIITGRKIYARVPKDTDEDKNWRYYDIPIIVVSQSDGLPLSGTPPGVKSP
jgi:hypothetical protein